MISPQKRAETSRPAWFSSAAVAVACVTAWAAALTVASGAPLAHAAAGDAAAEKGFEVAARSERSDRGFGDSTVSLEMVLRNEAGREARRQLTVRTLEVPDEALGDLSLVVFESPPDIAGTALLSHAKILEPDDQWLYLPSVKRVKRISSVNKSGPFVGSELAFEDLSGQELGKYEYRHMGEEPCGEPPGRDGLTCDIIERVPRYEHSGYSRQLVRVDRQVHQVRMVEYFDRKGDHLKTLTLDDHRSYQAPSEVAVWRAHRLTMTNHVTGKSTDLLYGDYAFGSGLSEDDFSKGALQRLR